MLRPIPTTSDELLILVLREGVGVLTWELRDAIIRELLPVEIAAGRLNRKAAYRAYREAMEGPEGRLYRRQYRSALKELEREAYFAAYWKAMNVWRSTCYRLERLDDQCGAEEA